jgi:hypothetical protein
MTNMKQWTAILIFGILLASCTSKKGVVQQSIQRISPADFIGESQEIPASVVEVALVEEVDLKIPGINPPLLEIAVEKSVLVPTRINAPVIVEALVGQVNGRPIFANEILEPIADQLLILSEEVQFDVSAFKNVAKMHIASQMQAVVKSELLVSEAKAGMTIEEKQGIFAYLQRVREDMASTEGGSQSAVTRKLLDEEGQTVDEYLDYKQQQVLIEQLLREKVSPHIQITWRDVMREWEKNKSSFNTAGEVILGMIRVSSDEDIAIVTESFDRHDSFASVAAAMGISNGGIWETFEIGEGGLAEIDVSDSILPSIVDLKKGEIAGPVEIGSARCWFTVIELTEPKIGSVWDPDTQMRLRDYLFGVQSMIEENRFLERILAEGSYDEFNSMVDRILYVAVTRYMH